MKILSESDYTFLSAQGVGRDCAAAVLDLDCCGRLNYKKLVLTRDRLICVAAVGAESGSYFNADGSLPDIDEAADVLLMPLDDIREAVILNNVSGGTLCIRTADGDRMLGAVTNTYMKELREFARSINSAVGLGQAEAAGHKEPCPERTGGPSAMPPPHGGPMPQDGKRVSAAEGRSLIVRIAAFFKPYWRRLLAALIFTLLTAALDLATPYLSGTVLFGRVLERDAALGDVLGRHGLDFTAALLMVVGTMLAVKLIGLLFGALKDAAVAKTVPYVVRDIKSQVFGAMNRLPLSFYLSRETGNLMTRVLSDADQISTLFIDNLPTVLIDGITVVGGAVMLMYIDWQIAAVMLVLLPLAMAVSRIVMPRLSVMHSRRHRAERTMNSHVNDNLTGARVIKAFGREQSESERFGRDNDNLRRAEVDIITAESRMSAVFELLGSMGNAIIYSVGAFLILSALADIGYSDLISISMYVGLIAGPMNDIARLMQQWARCMNSAQRIFEIIDAKSDLTESERPITPQNLRGDISLRSVRFSYTRGEPVLDEISFDVPSGQMLGIVGRSGAGKSTLVNLISRLYDPDEGEILIDGINIKDMSFDTLRGLVAMVSQETYIFMGTVAENIAYAKPDATRDEIVRAAVTAGAHDFICKLPDGYDTLIGTSGRELSGGERQRLSIARAVLTDPRILILDEATASVDTQTELAIQRSLDRLIQGRTTISIAHRLSTLRSADSLIVLENGRIVERGTHAELMERHGVFYRLAEIQRQTLLMKGIDG